MNFGTQDPGQWLLASLFAIASLIFCDIAVAQQQGYTQQNNGYQQQNSHPQDSYRQNGANYGTANQAQEQPIQRQQLSPQQVDRLKALGGQTPSKPIRPFAQLTAAQEKYRNEVLDYWQQQSEGIELYACDFQRFTYDTALTNHRDPKSGELSADTVAIGKVRYGKPGKALYETKSLYKFVGFEQAKKKDMAPYDAVSDPKFREKWVTDGESIYAFQYDLKMIVETKLPPEMRGEGAISNSPIPFLFGARKDQILERYWVRVTTPPGEEKEVWLEAWPKRAEDAQNYKKVEVILSIEPFLPVAIHMYDPQYNPKQNNFKSLYIKFENRKANSMLNKFQDFWNVFVRPTLPGLQWKFTTQEQLNATAAGARPTNQQLK